MPEVHPGSHKYRHSNAIPRTLGSDAARRGDALATSSTDGGMVQTTGSNGFLGVLQTPTAADADADDHIESEIASSDGISVAVQGVVRAKVSAAVGSAVSDGEKLVPAANGALANEDDGSGSPVQAGPGDLQAVSDEDSAGYALDFLG